MRPISLAYCLALMAVAAAAAAADGGGTQVIQKDRRFDPAALTVTQGASIVFVNQDDVTHNISITDPAGSALPSYEEEPGKSFSVTLTSAGIFKVRCLIHPKMKLDITVDSPKS